MDHHDKDKTYVWVRLQDGSFQPSSAKRSANHKKPRGAPKNDEVWGWSPGFYSETDGSCNFTLLGLEGSGENRSEHQLSNSAFQHLVESGDIVLANAWEEFDFTNRLALGGNEEEESYNYDEDESDDDGDEDSADSRQMSHLIDRPDEAPPHNLIDLTHLHEPSVVHALRHRYENTHTDMRNIYTDTGPILLAVNPFKHDESGALYGDDTLSRYRIEGERNWLKERGDKASNNGEVERTDDEEATLPPHVYAVADRTFRTMMTRLHPMNDVSDAVAKKSSQVGLEKTSGPKINQSVLVSGESGAGKTVTTKLLMAYLSKLSENSESESSETMSIEKRVLESNPIMESFGNARTIRNDNSSRFGKYIEMKFVSSNHTKGCVPSANLAGASIETYLLEKVRLVHQAPGERNFHIFYELFSLLDDESDEAQSSIDRMGLSYEMEDFHLINNSDTYDRRDGVLDTETFADLKQAMSVMGFDSSEQYSIFEIVCALLHASNLTFEKVGAVECKLQALNNHLDYVTDLLGISRDGLNDALCYYEITVGGKKETHKRVLSMEQCQKGTEALIKAAYGALFQYLVKRINASIAGDGVGAPRSRTRGSKEASIGILDIFGFESFEVNSFEQLCINYCNEALQQQFNRFVLRNEQEEYDREGITWTFIDFPENQDVLDLIDLKQTGIINILHDKCRTPGGNDHTFALAMYETCSGHGRFVADPRQVGEKLFAIQHYAGVVEYTVDGFIEKTRDELPKKCSDLLLSSSNGLVKKIAEILQPDDSPTTKGRRTPRGRASSRPTLGVQFSSQLQNLRQKIDETSPHYIRCLKPNGLLVPDHFDAALIADQLACAGVIEAVRVSRLGYPQRFSHNQFITRYRILGRRLKKKKNAKNYNPTKALVHSIAHRLLKDGDPKDDVGIQVGKSKVFLRREAYDKLEVMRRGRISTAAISIQKTVRAFLCRQQFDRMMRSSITIQSFIRRVLATKLVSEIRRRHNSTIIQRTFRKFSARKYLLSAVFMARWCQTRYRGSLGRRRYNELNRQRKALCIQRHYRGHVASKYLKKCLGAALAIQCAWRTHVARMSLAAKKSAARDLKSIVEERDRLRQEANALRSELKQVKADASSQNVVMVNASVDTSAKDAEIESLRETLGKLAKEKKSVENELEQAKESVAALKSERESMTTDRDDLKKVTKMLQSEINLQEEEVKRLRKLNKELSVEESAKIVSTDTSQVVELKRELQLLKETHSALQREHEDAQATLERQKDYDQVKLENDRVKTDYDQVKTINGELEGRIVSLQQDNQQLQTQMPAPRAASSNSNSTSAQVERIVAPITIVSGTTVDLDNEDDFARLREENELLRQQLELLRVDQDVTVDDADEYDESVALGDAEEYDEYESVDQSSYSSGTEFIGDTPLPDSVMNQISEEIENVTEEVILRTRAESESKISKLESEIAELKSEIERNKRVAKYDLDDTIRVNRSLREDLEAALEEKHALEEEFLEKCEEFETLTDDVDRFAETFAVQHEELQQLESQNKRLQSENEGLKSADEEQKRRIGELETQLDSAKTASALDVGTEIKALWKEIGKIKTPTAASSGAVERQHSENSSDSEETDDELGDSHRGGLRSALAKMGTSRF
mmetsp:Transcript_3111/g.7233  ORF Transcript_3111/g.7233 Transcript_3111/m.7233 type:complete len:1624 (+) Transcript_3111:476-5347(+)